MIHPEKLNPTALQMSSSAIEALAEINPNKTTEVTDLLIALLSKDNIASISISNVASTKIEDFLESLLQLAAKYTSTGGNGRIGLPSNKNLAISAEVEDLVSKARELAGKKSLNTGHLIMAELARKNSLLHALFNKLDIPNTLIQEVFNNSQIASNIEKKTSVITLLPTQIMEAVETIKPSKKIKEQLSLEIINDKLITDLIISIEGQSITTIVSENQSEALQQLLLLNKRLKEDTTNSLDFDLITIPDLDLLETNPEMAINQITRNYKGEVVYIPNLHRHWQNSGLRAAVNRGDLKLVTSVGEKALKKAIVDEKLPKTRPVFLEAPSYQEAVEIFVSEKQRIETSISNGGTQIKLSDEAIKLAVRYGQRYLTEEQLPQSALTLILAAATLVKMRRSEKLVGASSKLKNDSEINEEDISAALEQLTGIKANDDKEKFLTLDVELKKKIIGQDEAIEQVSNALLRYSEKIQDPSKPIATFMFLGPTGVGKTELAKAIAELVFGSQDALIRFDMSEYKEQHTAARLIGAPPGYVGYEDGGQLTNKVRSKPYSLVLFDEFEKAHETLQDMLLQITGEGRLTDSFGKVAKFENCLIIITGNVGSQFYQFEGEIGTEKVRKAVMEETKDKFRPEFLGRMRVIIFNSLKKENAQAILKIQANKLRKRISENHGIDLQLDQSVIDYIVEKGFSTEKGARKLASTLEEEVETPFARESARGNIKGKKSIVAKLEGDKVIFS